MSAICWPDNTPLALAKAQDHYLTAHAPDRRCRFEGPSAKKQARESGFAPFGQESHKG